MKIGASRRRPDKTPMGFTVTRAFRIAALAIVGCFAIAGAEDPKKPAKNELDGLYTIAACEKDGKEIPADKLKGSIIKFDGDKVMGTDKDKKEFFGSTFTIDKTTSPYTISMTSSAPVKGEKAMGIIEMKGDTVKLCYALPGGEAPKEFKTKEKQHCFTMKRATGSEK